MKEKLTLLGGLKPLNAIENLMLIVDQPETKQTNKPIDSAYKYILIQPKAINRFLHFWIK